jgi:hypothetical protein
MSVAFEMTRIALGFRDGIGDEIIAKKIIELAKAGEIDNSTMLDALAHQKCLSTRYVATSLISRLVEIEGASRQKDSYPRTFSQLPTNSSRLFTFKLPRLKGAARAYCQDLSMHCCDRGPNRDKQSDWRSIGHPAGNRVIAPHLKS